MVKLTSIITKTGDDGKTGLADGSRRSKSDKRVEAYGTIDEANSALGLARALMAEHGKKGEVLLPIVARIQNDMFNVGADLSTPDLSKTAGRIEEADVEYLEQKATALNKNLAALDSFVLPAGSPAVAALHLARTITRRAERRMVALHEEEAINMAALRYVNRLSDLLFIMARSLAGDKEEKWQPKK